MREITDKEFFELSKTDSVKVYLQRAGPWPYLLGLRGLVPGGSFRHGA